MIEIIATAAIAAPLFFWVGRRSMAGKVADEREYRDDWELTAVGLTDDLHDAKAAHDRCADALTTKERKLSAIRDLVGPTEGLRRGRLGQIAAILDGERA